MTTMSNNVPDSPLPLENRAGVTWGSVLGRLGPLIGLLFVVGLFSALRPKTFPTLDTFELVFRQTAVVGIGALGMTLIIIAGGIDLSAGSAIALVTVCVALLLPHQATNLETGEALITRGLPLWAAAIGGLLVGTTCGLVSGLLITRLKLVPFIITLGMMSVLRGTSKELAGEVTINPDPALVDRWLFVLLQPINPDRLWMLTPGVWIMLVLAAVVSGMLRYTRFGRHIFAIGSNEQTARLCGVPVERTKLYVYMLGAALTAVAGLLEFSNLTIGDPTTAVGKELNIIAACVIGGASLSGGHGTVSGSLIGALIMTSVAIGCSKMGWGSSREEIVTGAIIILAVGLDRLRHRRAA